MLSVVFYIMLNVIMPSVVWPSVMAPLFWLRVDVSLQPGNTKGGSISVPLTSRLTGLD